MDTRKVPKKVLPPPSMLDALIPLIFLVVAIVVAIVIYGDGAIGGPVQVAMFASAAVAGLVGWKNGHTEPEMAKAAVDSVASAMGAIFILFAVGALIGTWNMSGTIATLADYGIRFLNPSLFYVTAAIICAVIALGVGSSWTVMGTIGVALIAISGPLGLSAAITAGAVISGAYFGDKMSPLSETTNLAPAVTGTDLYTHIRAMMATTIPSIVIALVIYLFIGLGTDVSTALPESLAVGGIEEYFRTGLVPLLPLVVVIVLAVRKVPPVLAILAGALVGGLVAVIWQPSVVTAFAGGSGPLAMLEGVWTAMANGFVADTGSEQVDELLSGGGMESMLVTIWLIMAALAFGGIMNHCGFLAKLIEPMRRRANNDRKAMIATGTTAIGINVVAADQYLAIVLTGNVYKEDFRKRGIAPQSLSRQVEDTATVTSVLIPWNSCGAYAAGVLGVTTFAYLPFAFFNWINPLVSFLYDALGWQIHKVPADQTYPETPEEVEFYSVEEPYGKMKPDEG
ncbi:MAG: Na+/H+ antiporter NhaC [Actinobacteria bacterium]|nr:Na+/H+ antiporter NhaC [Actinomycetota bacterium]